MSGIGYRAHSKNKPDKPRLFISTTISQPWLDKLAQAFVVDYVDRSQLAQNLSTDALIASIADAHVLITELDQIDAHVLDQAPNLAVIVDCRAAVVNIDVTAATARGIVVINTPGRNGEAVADLTIALMVMALRKVDAAMRDLRNNRWQAMGMVQNYLTHRGHEMPGKTVGLIGMGAVGRKVAQRLTGFDVQILGVDPFVQPEAVAAFDVDMVELEHLMRNADIVSLHAPVNEATRRMINHKALGWMKSSAYLVNTARAALVDEASLITALQNGQIAGAALDVFHQEPVDLSDPLFQLPNVTALPHIGGATVEVVEHQSRLAYDALFSLINGNPFNVVNPSVLPAAQTRLAELEIQLPQP